MGLLDVLNGMQQGPRGPSTPSAEQGRGGMSPMSLAILGLLAFKAIKHLTSGQPGASPTPSQPSSPASPKTVSAGAASGEAGGLSDILKGGLGGLLAGGWEADDLSVAEIDGERRIALEQEFPKVRVVPMSRRVRALLPQRDFLPSPWGRCSAAGVPLGDTGAGPGNCVPGCLARTWEASPARTWNCCAQTGQTSASTAPSEPRDSEDPEEDGKAPPGGSGGTDESANISAESLANVTAHRLPT